MAMTRNLQHINCCQTRANCGWLDTKCRSRLPFFNVHFVSQPALSEIGCWKRCSRNKQCPSRQRIVCLRPPLECPLPYCASARLRPCGPCGPLAQTLNVGQRGRVLTLAVRRLSDLGKASCRSPKKSVLLAQQRLVSLMSAVDQAAELTLTWGMPDLDCSALRMSQGVLAAAIPPTAARVLMREASSICPAQAQTVLNNDQQRCRC